VSRVALVSPYALSVFGGVQEQVLAMARTLQSRGLEVLVVAPDSSDCDDHGTTVPIERFGRLLSIPANGSRAPVTVSLAASRAAQQCVERFAPHVVHLHEPFAPVFGYQLLRTHQLPLVGTFHRAGGGPAYSLTRPVLMKLARGIDCATAVSTSATETILEGANVRATTVFNGFETDRFREYARTSHAVPTVFFIGRLEARKGARTVLEAARLANQQGRGWRFVVAGDGPEAAQLRREFAELSSVDFVGSVSDSDKRRLLREADVLVAASTHGESFGLVLLEAMAAETPVVASDIDGYREAAAGHATLFEPRNATSLVDAITRALGADVTNIAGAREHAEAWSMNSLMDLYDEIYDRAIDRFASCQ
jgi:phosphatidylinositol alpha-mannosyltransferase